MTLAPDRFRLAMGNLAAGITVVTVKDDAGRGLGMTASSVTSLSLHPPMLLVCIDKSALLHDLIVVRSPAFAVSILAEDQADVARYFAEKDRHTFETDGGLTSPAGVPLVSGALGHLECVRGAVYAGGDHSIVTGTVEWAEMRAGAPLIHFRSGFGRLARLVIGDLVQDAPAQHSVEGLLNPPGQ